MLDSNGVLLLSSRDVFSFEKSFYFSGTLIHSQKVINGEGFLGPDTIGMLPSFESLLSDSVGRFLLVFSDGECTRVATDSSGSEPLFVYEDGNNWAVSNSLYALSRFASSQGWRLSVDNYALSSMFVDHSIGRTMLSSQSIYKEIRLVLLDRYIEIEYEGNDFQVLALPKRVINDRYEDALISWFVQWRGCLSSIAMAADKEKKPIVDLSGGVDSRLVLSIALPDVVKSNLDVYSQPSSSVDLAVANHLGSELGFNVNSTPPNRKLISVHSQYERYVHGNFGFYNLPVSPVLSQGLASQFKINGIGGEVIRDFYSGTGREWLGKLKKLMPDELSDHYDGVRGVLESSYSELDIDPDSPTGLREHYRQFRSRIHGGRRLHEKFKYTFLSPLLDPQLQLISKLPDAPAPLEIFRDILVLGGGANLACLAFDKKSKNISSSFARESPFYDVSDDILKSREVSFDYYSVFEGDACNKGADMFFDLSCNYGSLQDAIQGESARLYNELSESLPMHLKEVYYKGKKKEGRLEKIDEVTWHSVFLALNLAR